MNARPQLRDAGDAALLLQLEPVIDPTVNARAIAIADAMKQRGVPGVRDVVSTFHSVAVYFDPLRADHGEVSAALREAMTAPPVVAAGRQHRIPVAYGGEDGPDLDAVAAHAGLTLTQAIARHADVAYRVFMLGFQPGFAYMGLVDPAIAVARRSTPRLAVPRGSVGIAGRQTGVYPAASPGGWQIVGRALEPVLDYAQSPPARFAPGDSVVFVPARADRRSPDVPNSSVLADAEICLNVLRPGLFTTVQDGGAWGEQGIGAPVSGAMDSLSHTIANLSVGNDRDAGALEMTIAGPELRVERESTIAVAGADLSPTIDGTPIELQKAIPCRRGSLIRFGDRRGGARSYLAVSGGLKVERRFPRQAITAGQSLGAGSARRQPARRLSNRVSPPTGGARLRVMPGPQRDQVAGSFEAVCEDRFIVSPQSNRIGYRLTGRTLQSGTGAMISDATFPGAIQLPPSGDPILLLADRQTTGGYPQVAIVITADLPVAGQLAPGDWIEFVPCSREEAVAALAAQERWLDAS